MIISKKIQYQDKEKAVNSVLAMVWSEFYKNLSFTDEPIDLAVWAYDSDPARVVAIPAYRDIECEVEPEFAIGVLITGFDGLCERARSRTGTDEESNRVLAPLFAEFENWLVEGIAKSWRSKDIERKHKASQVENLGVYLADHGDFIPNEFAEMRWVC